MSYDVYLKKNTTPHHIIEAMDELRAAGKKLVEAVRKENDDKASAAWRVEDGIESACSAAVGEDETIDVGNYTSNLAHFWAWALGDNLYDVLQDNAGRDVAPKFEAALGKIELTPDSEMEHFNPDNGWGDFHSAADYLRKIYAVALEYPRGIFDVSN